MCMQLCTSSFGRLTCQQTTCPAILKRTGEPSSEVYAWPLELGSFQSVRSFVDKFAAEGNGALNALVANAGVFSTDQYSQSGDGWELTCILFPRLLVQTHLTALSSLQAASKLSFQRVAELSALAVLDKLFLSRFAFTFGLGVEFFTLFYSRVEAITEPERYPRNYYPARIWRQVRHSCARMTNP